MEKSEFCYWYLRCKIHLSKKENKIADSIHNEKIKTILSKEARVYKTDDTITTDCKEERVNIELSENDEIVRIWLG